MATEFEQETTLWETNFEEDDNVFGETEDNYLEQEEQEESYSDEPDSKEEETGVENQPSNEDDVNYTFFLANALKEKGILNVDNIPEDIEEEEVLELYKEAHQERIRADIEAEISTALQSRGITDDHLTMAMAIQAGYPPEFLMEQNRYKYYSSLPEDVDIEDKKQVITEWYKYRNLYEDEIKEKLDELELDDDKLETNFKRAKDTFKYLDQEFEKQVRQEALERERIAFEIQEKNRRLLQSVRTTGEIAGEKMSRPQLEQFEKGIFLRDQMLEINGQVYQASKFDKFLYDIQNNFEAQLLAYKLFTMRDVDRQALEQQIESKTEEKLLGGLKTAIEKKYKGTIKKGDKGDRRYEISPNAKVFKVR